ncbi:EAL domain-containing protein [Psychromonas sp.]|nr:EAL domain-containing protein [Psychromonas sp.]
MNNHSLFANKNTILGASVLLGAYLILILTVTNLGQSKLELANQNELHLKVDHYAELLGNYFSRARRSLDLVSKDRTINTYFANKSSGMSMTYGLSSSLFNVQKLLKQETKHKQDTNDHVFSRITLLGLDNKVIADSASELKLNRANINVEELKLQQQRMLVDNTEGQLSIRLAATIFFQKKPIALLIAELDNKPIIQQLTAQEYEGSGSRIELVSEYGNLFIWDSLNASYPHYPQIESAHFLVQKKIKNAPFILDTRFESVNGNDLFTSKWFVLVISLLAIPVFFGLYYLIHIERKNTLLKTQIAHSKKQREDLSKHNLELENEVSKRKASEKKIAFQATHDALTGLPNRSYSLERLSDAIEHSKKSHHKVLVMYVDLDNFKQINDTMGHAVGDIILQQTSKRLLKTVDKADTVARLSGDEFMLIFHDVRDSEHATELAEKVLNAFEKPFNMGDYPFYTSTSVGVALYPEHGEDPDTLLKSADMALYRVKDAGRNNFIFYEPKMSDEVSRKVMVTHRLREAIKENLLEMYYQPLIDLNTQKIVGAEALMRWIDPELGFVSPDEFISLAEKNGLIGELGSFALNKAANQASLWQQIMPLQIAINFSSIQFRDCEGLLNEIQQVLLKTGLPPEKLDVEVTESLLINQGHELSTMLQSLRGMGIELSIDDFGTGYSALSYLQKYSFTKLKIDRAFIMNLTENSADQLLVKAIVAMAKALDLKVVAEGIEEKEQMEFLVGLNCEYGQGYLFSKPVTTGEFEKLLLKQVATEQ